MLYDYKCPVCDNLRVDVLVSKSDQVVFCCVCMTEMERMLSIPSIKITDGAISAHNNKWGKTGYQDSGQHMKGTDNGVRIGKIKK